MKTLLLVTWFLVASDGGAHTRVIREEFDYPEKCEAAKASIRADADRVSKEASRFMWVRVSAVCVKA